MLVGSERLVPPALVAIVVPAISEEGPEGVERPSGAAAARTFLGCSRVLACRRTTTRNPCCAWPQRSLDASPYRVTMRWLTMPTWPGPVRALLEEHVGVRE